MSGERNGSGIDRRQLLALAGGTALGVVGGLRPGVGRWAAAQDGTAVPIKGKIGFGQPDRTADVYKPLIAGAKAEGKKRGYEILESFAEGRADKQIAEINNWIGLGVDAMVILPLDEKAMQPAIQKCHDAGIKFVGYANIIENEDGYITWDNKTGAEMLGTHAANWINETLGGQAEVAFLTAEFHQTGRERIHGAEAKLLELAPNIKVVNRTEAVLAPEAFTATQSILQANPNLSMLICIADDGCLGAAQAFQATSRDPSTIYIAGYDGSREAMKKILEGGPIKATAALPLFDIGKSVTWVPDNILSGNDPTYFVHQYQLVTTETPDLANKLIADYDLS
jgi:ribose transport system substrate-binding protein